MGESILDEYVASVVLTAGEDGTDDDRQERVLREAVSYASELHRRFMWELSSLVVRHQAQGHPEGHAAPIVSAPIV